MFLHFFDIDIESFNLFSYMMGVSTVALSSYWNGRIRWTRIAFIYISSLALYYGLIVTGHL